MINELRDLIRSGTLDAKQYNDVTFIIYDLERQEEKIPPQPYLEVVCDENNVIISEKIIIGV
jgi:hypothetical protein